MNIAFSPVADLDAPAAGAMLALDNSFARLPAAFYTRLAPTALPNPYAALLREVAARTGRLIAQWQAVGWCHGVTDSNNISILGLTIDYGPFGFIDGFNADHVCNHSDENGRYTCMECNRRSVNGTATHSARR